MTAFVIHPSWIDGLTELFAGFPFEAMEQLRRGEVVHIDGLLIVAQRHIPIDLAPVRRPIDTAANMTELRQRLRHGWRAR